MCECGCKQAYTQIDFIASHLYSVPNCKKCVLWKKEDNRIITSLHACIPCVVKLFSKSLIKWLYL